MKDLKLDILSTVSGARFNANTELMSIGFNLGGIHASTIQGLNELLGQPVKPSNTKAANKLGGNHASIMQGLSELLGRAVKPSDIKAANKLLPQ